MNARVSYSFQRFPYGACPARSRRNKPYIPTSVGRKELDEETGLYYYGARYYDPKISLWLSVDPLAGEYPSVSPYTYTYANPIRFIDPTGMEGEAWDDWIKNLKTGEYEWRNEVTSPENTPEGYKYIGAKNQDIIKDLFDNNYLRPTTTTDLGTITLLNSKGGYAIINFKGKTIMYIRIIADVATEGYGQHLKKTFKGVYIEAALQGRLVIPPTYDNPQPNKETRFIVENFLINGRPMKFIRNTTLEMSNPDNYVGGYFSSYFPKSYFIGKCGYFEINVKGYYEVNKMPVKAFTIFGYISNITNFTYLNKNIYFEN